MVRRNVPLERKLIEQRGLFDFTMSHHDLQSCLLQRLNQRMSCVATEDFLKKIGHKPTVSPGEKSTRLTLNAWRATSSKWFGSTSRTLDEQPCQRVDARLPWPVMASARAEAAAEPPAKGGGRENRHQQRRHIEDRDISLAGITDTAGDCRAPDAMHHGDQRQRHRGDDAAEAAGCSRGPERPREQDEIEPDPDLV